MLCHSFKVSNNQDQILCEYNTLFIHSFQIVVCELTRDGFYATYSNEQPLSDIPETCRVYALEMHSDDQQTSQESGNYESQTLQIILLHVEKKSQSLPRWVILNNVFFRDVTA